MQLYKDYYHNFEDAIKEPDAVQGLRIGGTRWSARLSEVLKFPHLQAIHMQARSIHWTEEDVANLRKCERLKDIFLKVLLFPPGPIPEKVAGITQLEKLAIHPLKDRVIPFEIFELPHLTSLELYEVNGEQVDDILKRMVLAKGLENLTITFNHQSEFPKGLLAEIKNIPTLKSLRLKGSSEVPKEILELPHLESLSIEGTAIPDWLWQLNGLKSLELNHNYLAVLPPAFAEFKQLERLNFRLNSLAEIPDFICDFSNLKYLNLSYNYFTQLPDRIGNLAQLETLELATTNLESLPASFSQLKQLQPHLVLSQTKLPSFPEELCGLTQLTSIDFSQHKITDLPDAILKLTNLETLDLRGCKIKEFPTVLFQMKSLNELTLTQNPITRGGGKVLKKHMNKTFFGPDNQSFSPQQKKQLLILLREDAQTAKQQIPLKEMLAFVDNGSKVSRANALQYISELHPSPFTATASIQKVLLLGKPVGKSKAVLKKAVKAAGLQEVKNLKDGPDVVIIGENPGPAFQEALKMELPFGTASQFL